MDRLSSTNANRTLSPEVLERALHATDIMIVLTDPKEADNPIVWANDYFCESTGYTRDEVIGRNCRFLQGSDRDQPERTRIREAVQAGESVHVQIRNYRKDGTPFENDLFISPVREDRSDPESEVLYFAGVQNDVSVRVRAQADVADREREIEETAENERERFGMDLHDGLGQELFGLGMHVQSLADALAREGSPHADEAGRIVSLVHAALQSARGMAHGLNPVDASPHGLGDALRRLSATAQETSPGLAVTCRVEPVAFVDRRDARHLYRIAQEALANAVEHAKAQTVTVTLRTAPVADRMAVHLEVWDDGVGISSDDRSGAAAQAEAARRGMGLYSMRHRADLIGARLAIARHDEGGTVVRCVLAGYDRHGTDDSRSRLGERE